MSSAAAGPAAQPSVAAVRVPWRAAFVVDGTDAVPFLQRLLTADIAAPRTGEGCRSLLLDGRGHVLADLDVWVMAEGLLLATHADLVDATLRELGRRVLRADVRLRRVEQHVVTLHGPGVTVALGELGLRPPGPSCHAHVQAAFAGAQVHLRRCAQALDGIEVAAADPTAIDGLLDKLAGLSTSVARLTDEQTTALRIEAGVPAWGAEITGAEFPQELGLEAAVSFDKGCYLGQETVARIQYRGHVNRHLRGLRLASPAAVGEALWADGRQVGSVTSAARSHRFGAIALAWVQRAHADPGTRLQRRSDGAAEVVGLPFA